MTHCPSCAATNPDTAAWCNQCYASLRAPEPQPVAVGAPAMTVAAPAVAADAPAGDLSAAAVPQETGFRRRGDELEWQCPSCAEFNNIDIFRCVICDTPLADRYRDPEPETTANWSKAIMLTAVVPGAGHITVGQPGTGFARATLFLLWLTGGLGLIAAGGAVAMPGAAPLFCGALLVWVASVYDVMQLAEKGKPLLQGRFLLWLVVAVTLLCLLGVAGAGVAAQPF